MTTASLLTVLLLAVVAAAHLLRIILGIPVTIGTTALPIWASVIAVIVPTLSCRGALA